MVGAPCAVRLDLAVGEPSLYPVDRLNVLLRRRAYQQPDLVGAHARGAGHPDLRQEIARQAMQYRYRGAGSAAIFTAAKLDAGCDRRSSCRRHPYSWLARIPASRATPETLALGSSEAATSRSFSALLQRRRRSTEVMTSTAGLLM